MGACARVRRARTASPRHCARREQSDERGLAQSGSGAVQAVRPKESLAPHPRYLRLAPTASRRRFLLDPLDLPPPLTASPRRARRWPWPPDAIVGRLGLGAPYVTLWVVRQMSLPGPELDERARSLFRALQVLLPSTPNFSVARRAAPLRAARGPRRRSRRATSPRPTAGDRPY